MRKAKALRITGFVGALCASAALVGTSVSGTGAYFTDSHDGSINASTGGISVDVSPADGQLNFNNLLPGDYQTLSVTYTSRAVGGTEDVWLVFPKYGVPGDAFTSTPQAGPTPLGRYGHFAVSAPAGSFSSYNLTLSPNGGENAADACAIDGQGHGGSSTPLSSPSDVPPYCAPAPAILLQSNMAAGATGKASITFGVTPLLQGGQDMATAPVEQYQIVATQHGILPNDPFNG
jgi:hypothetical protein